MMRKEIAGRLEIIILSLISLNLYVRALWIALVGQTLNPSVMIVAAPLALIMYLWVLQSTVKPTSKLEVKRQAKTDFLLLIGVFIMAVGTWLSTQAYEALILVETELNALWWREVAMIIEGLALIALWSSWTWRQYAQNKQLAWRLHYPLSITVFTLPWEGVLRGIDQPLQRLSTDISVYCLTLFDTIYDWKRPLNISYWDPITIYSDHFYLIINETCAGVNLLISMSLYAVGFAWVMGANVKRAWTLIVYIIPLCIIFNGLRIAVIFCLGHFGNQALATGFWHEGSAYICQGALFVVMALINHILGLERVSSRHDPLT